MVGKPRSTRSTSSRRAALTGLSRHVLHPLRVASSFAVIDPITRSLYLTGCLVSACTEMSAPAQTRADTSRRCRCCRSQPAHRPRGPSGDGGQIAHFHRDGARRFHHTSTVFGDLGGNAGTDPAGPYCSTVTFIRLSSPLASVLTGSYTLAGIST